MNIYYRYITFCFPRETLISTYNHVLVGNYRYITKPLASGQSFSYLWQLLLLQYPADHLSSWIDRTLHNLYIMSINLLQLLEWFLNWFLDNVFTVFTHEYSGTTRTYYLASWQKHSGTCSYIVLVYGTITWCMWIDHYLWQSKSLYIFEYCTLKSWKNVLYN